MRPEAQIKSYIRDAFVPSVSKLTAVKLLKKDEVREVQHQ